VHEQPAWRLLLRQFASPIELILLGATVVSGVLGDVTDAVIIVVILLLSGLLGFVQERGAGKAMRAMLAAIEATARVRRDGREVTIPAREVRVGDVALLREGDMPPGDGVVRVSDALAMDESALTGETFPVEKSATGQGDAARVFLGSHVVSGSGEIEVRDLGAATRMGAVEARMRTAPPRTGFERGMTRFGLLLTRIMVVLVVAIFLVNLVLARPLIDSALFSLALAVGLTPQLLPAIVSIGLAQGARRMARRRVIVRRLDAIEDFGAMTVLCSDKTGTMTAGEIELDRALDPAGAPSDRVATLASLNAGLQRGFANPIDEALLRAHPLPAGARAVAEAPYDFTRRRLSVLAESGGERTMITKGAFDAVLAVCAVDDAEAAALRDRFAALSADGYRVLGAATRRVTGDAITPADETGMEFAGLLTFADPAKADARETIAAIAASGVSVRMVTGDNRYIAARVAGEVGIDAGVVLTGSKIDARDDATLARDAPGIQVFAEVDPVQKERVIRALRAAGEVVGYLGDGINDAPPLHAADVGISVDSAVPVAKESAAIVLLDKELGVLLDGLEEGRRTFANTMKYIFMTMSANFGNMLSMAIAAVVLPFLPLLAGQILLINLLTDLPATMLATDAVDTRQLARPQRWNLRLIRTYMIVFGAVSSVFDLTTFALLRWGYQAEAVEFRSAWFVGSVLTEVAVLFALRTRGPIWSSRPSRGIVVVSAVVAAAAVAIPYTPLAGPLGMVALPASLLGFVVAIAIAYVVATELVKRVFWRSRRGAPHPAG